MEKQTSSSLSLLSLLPEGKVESDVRFADTTVTGVCTVYKSRTDNESEYMLRTIGVAALERNNLTEAVRIALDQAYSTAMSHIAGVSGATTHKAKSSSSIKKPTSEQKPNQPEVVTPPVGNANVEDNAPNDDSDTTDADTVITPSSVDLSSVLDFSDSAASNPTEQVDSPLQEQPSSGGIEKIEFDQSTLFPASDLLNTSGGTENTGVDDDVDPGYQKALGTQITIFGKMNDCNGWTAGKILEQHPERIINFCNRNNDEATKYTGPRTDQVEALRMLYPDAVRKVQSAA